MAQRTVNDRQLDVLQWVVAGCPAREWPDTTYKTVAIALQNRRLAKVSKKRGSWSVIATDAGRYFVEHGAYPAGHWSERPAEAKPAKATAVTPPSPSASGREGVTAKRPVEQFADDVLAAMADASNTWGGLMVDDRDRGYYANLAALRSGTERLPRASSGSRSVSSTHARRTGASTRRRGNSLTFPTGWRSSPTPFPSPSR